MFLIFFQSCIFRSVVVKKQRIKVKRFCFLKINGKKCFVINDQVLFCSCPVDVNEMNV